MQQWQSSLAALPVLGAAAVGVMLFAALVPEVELARPATAELLAPPTLAATPSVPRCPGCGWIEGKREILPEAGDARAPKIFEYTLRMPDGSMSLFQETLPTSWRLGERVIVIGGAAPLAAP